MGLKRVLITGATGFTGRHACRRFADAGWEVVAVASGRSRQLAGTGASRGGKTIRWVSCDLTDREAVRGLIRETAPDALLHLAGQNAVDRSWREPDLTLVANALSTVYLLEAMREGRKGGRSLVVGSMLREPPESCPHPYSYSKFVQVSSALAWHRWYGMEVVVAEPSNLIGPGGSGGICGKIARWAAQAERGGSSSASEVPPFRLSSLTERRDYLDVRDAVNAYEILLREGESGMPYAVESGTMRSLEEIRAEFGRIAGIPLRWEIGSAAAAGESPRPRDCSPVRSLGWSPAIPFSDSVRDALEEERGRYRERGEERAE